MNWAYLGPITQRHPLALKQKTQPVCALRLHFIKEQCLSQDLPRVGNSQNTTKNCCNKSDFVRSLYAAYIRMFTEASTQIGLSTNKQIWNTSIVQVNQPKLSNSYALLRFKKACNRLPPPATPCSDFQTTVPVKAR